MSIALAEETTKAAQLLPDLAQTLGEPLALWSRASGFLPVDGAGPAALWSSLEGQVRLRAGGGPSAIPLDAERLLLVLPLEAENDGDPLAAVGLFPASVKNEHNGWTCGALVRTAGLALQAARQSEACRQAEQEADAVSGNLASTYEEISLLHGLTRKLQLSISQRELAVLALDWLLDCLPAAGIFLHCVPSEPASEMEFEQQSMCLLAGDCPLDEAASRLFAKQLEAVGDGEESVRGCRSVSGVEFPGLDHYLAVPLCERDQRLGWLVAVNNVDHDSFSSIEASLMRSVSTILSIHFANREHYQKQENLVADVVRALASAIDAKDPYTRGHSERVAQISVLLARSMDFDDEFVRTMYIGGLLHDIGKIGVDDQVLRKDGRLTDEEFEQIKQHPELGYNILADLDPLADVLPIVLHHHEQWDGGGYPHGLKGEETPVSARIASVADAFDAMTSDRPYREGMPLAKVENILRGGAGQQWDAAVVKAFFDTRREIVKLIYKGERPPGQPED